MQAGSWLSLLKSLSARTIGIWWSMLVRICTENDIPGTIEHISWEEIKGSAIPGCRSSHVGQSTPKTSSGAAFVAMVWPADLGKATRS
jgi:hypothetical protein